MQRWLVWLGLLLMAAASTWLLRSLEQDRPVTALDPQRVDYILTDFTAQRFDSEGRLLHQLAAAQMVHYRAGQSELIAPVMVFYRDQQAQWQVESERGEVSADGDVIWLRGAAHMLRLNAAEDRKRLEIFSRDVRVEQQRQFAETSEPSRILHAGGETRSVGMRVFMEHQQIEFLSQVRGHYEQP